VDNTAFVESFVIALAGAILFLLVDKYEREGPVARLLKFLVLFVAGVAIVHKLQPMFGLALFTHLGGRRRLLQFLPFYFAEPSIQRLPRAHQTGPRLDADELRASSLVRVYQVTIVLVADVSPEIVQQCFHDRQFAFV
jgi:hypothetical protein